MAKSVDPDQTPGLTILVYIVCSGTSIPIVRVNWVYQDPLRYQQSAETLCSCTFITMTSN